MVSHEAAMLPRARHAAPLTASGSASASRFESAPLRPASFTSASRTLIDLMDSDEDEGDEQLQQLLGEMSDDDDDDQPGSLIYCRAAAAATKCAVSSAH